MPKSILGFSFISISSKNKNLSQNPDKKKPRQSHFSSAEGFLPDPSVSRTADGKERRLFGIKPDRLKESR